LTCRQSNLICPCGSSHMTIKMHLSGWLMALFLLNGGFIFAGGVKSKVITTSPLTITVPDDRFLKITNFTQEGGTERGVVRVNLSGDAGGIANVLSATRIDLSTGINSQNFPEIVNRVIIAGPAEVRITPVIGATLVISYKKEPNGAEAEPTPTPVVISPTPSGTATPSATPIPTFTPIFSPTP
jgi:hypothetical protein